MSSPQESIYSLADGGGQPGIKLGVPTGVGLRAGDSRARLPAMSDETFALYEGMRDQFVQTRSEGSQGDFDNADVYANWKESKPSVMTDAGPGRAPMTQDQFRRWEIERRNRPTPATWFDGVLAEGRASVNSNWGGVQDAAAVNRAPAAYLIAGGMRLLGNLGYSVAEMGAAVVNSPGQGALGARNGIANFGSDSFNAGANLLKTSLDGYTLLAEANSLAPNGYFSGFRESEAYNLSPLFANENDAQAGGSLMANLATATALTKFGGYNIRVRNFSAETGSTVPEFASEIRGGVGGQALDAASSRPGREVYGPYYDEARALAKEKPDFFPDPDAPGTRVMTSAEVFDARRQYNQAVSQGLTTRGHHRQGLAFGGDPIAAENIVFTGETTISRKLLKGVDLDFYVDYGKVDAKRLMLHRDTLGGVLKFGPNPQHSEATSFQNKVLRWQREQGLR